MSTAEPERPRALPATEIARELLRLGPDTTGLARELREILTDTTDDLLIHGRGAVGRERPVSVGHRAHGPYTAEDLHDLPDDGRARELVDGWLIELSSNVRHNLVTSALSGVLNRVAQDAGTDPYVAVAPEITTSRGVRRPDVAVIDGDAVLTAAHLGRSVFHGPDVLLAAEVVVRCGGSERQDRVEKLVEYARTGIDQYWIVDFDPDVQIQVHVLDGDSYRLERVVTAGDTMRIDEPVAVSFTVADLATWRGEKI